MIGSLLYLIVSRFDIMFKVCLCARYQCNPKEFYLYVVKRIFRYLLGTKNFKLRHLKGSWLDLMGYLDANFASSKLEKSQVEHINSYEIVLCHGMVRSKP